MLTSGTELLFASGPTVTIVGADPSDPSQTIIDAAGTPAIPRRVIEVDSGRGATLKNVEIKGGLSAERRGRDQRRPERHLRRRWRRDPQ